MNTQKIKELNTKHIIQKHYIIHTFNKNVKKTVKFHAPKWQTLKFFIEYQPWITLLSQRLLQNMHTFNKKMQYKALMSEKIELYSFKFKSTNQSKTPVVVILT